MKKLSTSGEVGGGNVKKNSRLTKWRLVGIITSILIILGVAVLTSLGGDAFAASAHGGKHKTPTPTPHHTPTPTPGGSKGTVTVWIQVTDSCRHALSGATFTVSGPGINTTTAPTAGTVPVSIGGGSCPIQRGSCVSTSTGCTSIALNVPATGINTYTITVAKTANPSGSNLSFAVCQGGSDCPDGPEVATVNISSSGSVSATTHNFYPDGFSVTWPFGGTFNGSKSDPIMFHEFGIGNGSIQCDGDHDKDDYLTGTPGSHCDSDHG
ncbi:MAG TPA: hypothetical protein VKR06_40710 [Ktedonosporobacter sp.]|nr:hypothetical protein [Ktedonosporobacter sp.]